ncbi:MAG: hypothetical protein WC648_01325 [Candidatus Paceibacterota bacterium]|jgi:hypothetical protein
MKDFIKQLYKSLYKEDLIQTVTVEYCAPIVIPPKTNREKLFDTAVSFLGKDASPKDYASDEYGCMESVDSIHFACFGSYIKSTDTIPSIKTAQTYPVLQKTFTEVTEPMEGDIVISPTGYGNGKVTSGHIGIMGRSNIIMSNNSSNGKFEENYTTTTWKNYFVTKGGFPMKFFRKT